MQKKRGLRKPRRPLSVSRSGSGLRLKKKTDWAGVGPADAFRSGLNYHIRIPAQRMAYRMFRKIQITAAQLAGDFVKEEYSPIVEPQLAPCYSTYPSALSIHAAIGLTGFLEFQQRTKVGNLEAVMSEYLANPAVHDQLEVHEASYEKMARFICQRIQKRLLLEDLSRHPAMRTVEFYRLFAASQHHLEFRSVQDILDVVILFGDVMPDWQKLDLHPLTSALMEKIELASVPFFDLLPTTGSEDLTALGQNWVRTLCQTIAPYLPGPEGVLDDSRVTTARVPFASGDSLADGRFDRRLEPDSKPDLQADEKTAPLEQAQEPVLFEPQDPLPAAASRLTGKGDQETDQIIKNLTAALSQASAQPNQWEDMRSDLLEESLRTSSFATGPIEGNPADGHEVQVNLGNNQTGSGEIHDRPLALSENHIEYERLLEKAAPITRYLKKILYPNIEQIPAPVNLCTSGALDPARIALSPMSEAIFKRNPIKEVSDKRGKPVLLIACDASSSLSRNEMEMTKVLACSWLNATAGSEVEMLAGIYHSDHIRAGVSGPLVQWMYHPRKTPAISRREAARSIVSLPESGSGSQSDALSISFMLNEAKSLARGRMIYLILISDCAWNSSFHTNELSAREEIQASLAEFNDGGTDALDATLVALDKDSDTGLESHMDRIIYVSNDELTDFAKVAEKIGTEVATVMRSRKHLLKIR